MAGLLTSANLGDIQFLRQTTARDGDYESTMVRAGLLRQIINDAERLHQIEELLPRFIDATSMRQIMAEVGA